MAQGEVLQQGLWLNCYFLQLCLAAAAGLPGSLMVCWGGLFLFLSVFACVQAPHFLKCHALMDIGTIRQCSAARTSTERQQGTGAVGLVLKAVT